MKPLFFLCLWIALPLGLLAQTPDPLESIIESEKDQWLRHQQVQPRSGLNSADNRSDIRYCRLHWTVDPAVRYIKGAVMTVFEPAETISSLDFDFSSAL
ncbi:MAG TPA: hypothetical protein PKH43_07585, partial [Saprospiraceae bacterium]|nr:hypothetical protein [Saprospiraceae bacterium]